MYYVVVIETEHGSMDYKAFSNSGDAVKRYGKAQTAQFSEAPVKIGSAEPKVIVSCGPFKAATRDLREAVQLVKDGRAETLKPFGVPTIDDL